MGTIKALDTSISKNELKKILFSCCRRFTLYLDGVMTVKEYVNREKQTSGGAERQTLLAHTTHTQPRGSCLFDILSRQSWNSGYYKYIYKRDNSSSSSLVSLIRPYFMLSAITLPTSNKCKISIFKVDRTCIPFSFPVFQS